MSRSSPSLSSNLSIPLLPDEEENYPTEGMLRKARGINRIITTTGMVSLGLLAGLITHHSLEDKGWPLPLSILADMISFGTAIVGKVAIVLFFNQATALEGFKKICRKQLPDYFRLAEKSVREKLQWSVNFLLSVNSSLFLAGLVEVSFKKSGDLLIEFDTKTTRFMGSQLKQWYIYLPFVLSSLYANMVAWPSAHSSGYEQKKALLNWLRQRPWKPNEKEEKLKEVNFHVRNTHRRVLGELKNIIEGDDRSPVINRLLEIENSDQREPDDFHQSTLVKVDRLLALEPYELRQKYLGKSDKKYIPLSSKQFFIKHALALLTTGTSIYGFFNVIGLSHAVWKNWNAEGFSRYGAGYLAYYSMAEIVMLTVYPMFCNLFDIARQGIDPYVFSRRKLAFIISMVSFVGVFGGLANAEQSYLDGESLYDVINADISSFFVDAFSIYMVFKSAFESKIKESPATDSITLLKHQFLKLQLLGNEACALDTNDDTAALLEKFEEEENDNAEHRRSCPCVIL
ncbi:hypothetical protein CbuD7D7780_06685 [Coxiella burnetii]|uniref:Hypothetical membrane spanning protein n=1 Tax=Coxiella burnetii (strain Dugway 5J108-111) TaxID=434922 RepID=A9KFR1_COXBN|nr:hypothetical protein [Coxiella burnetii]ABS76602.1 hypothetical membrane spanning protein [Coxiella burnetii Dugway 5J108-111]OYK80065.1 hypothetical protein CbuD7E6568_06655 [Coxiella burnetii]OYK82146.1 hypothetical protein CbuD7D7780_06685 [Coxiella burnetii]